MPNDQPTLDALQLSDALTDGVVNLEPRLYDLQTGMLIKRSNITWKGIPERTILQLNTSGWMFQTSSSWSNLLNITFEDIIFDGNGKTGALVAYGSNANRLTFRRCMFIGSPDNGLLFKGVEGVTIEDCTFREPGIPKMQAVGIQNGCRNVSIRRNRFAFCREGIIGDTGDGEYPMIDDVRIQDNHFEGGWWFIKALFSGSGAAVTYSATGLTDTGAAFTGITVPYQHNVLALPIRQTGTATIDQLKLTDAGATFITAGVKRGELVRIGTVFGIVKAVESETVLHVEAWLDNTTYLPGAAANGVYTAYGVNIGVVTAFTATTVTVSRWHDLDGNTVTPVAGTRYEVLYKRPNYHMNLEAGVRDAVVDGNTILRGWSDQVSIYGQRARVTNNTIEDGEDMAITLHGRDNLVSLNRIRHSGAGGIYTECDDSLIGLNHVADSQWVNNVNIIYAGDVMIAGSRNKVLGNICERTSVAHGHYGVVLHTASAIADNEIEHNTTRGHLTSGLRLNGGTIANTRLSGNNFTEPTPATGAGTLSFAVPQTQLPLTLESGTVLIPV